MSYFKNFPTINYPFLGKLVPTIDEKVQYLECADIMVRYKIRDTIMNNPLAVYQYQWKDSDRPDIVARNYYGSVDYAWLVMISAQVFEWIYDLPMNRETFELYLIDKYGEDGTELVNIIHHYEDGDGAVIDEQTYYNISDPGKRIVSVYDYEYTANEARRNVKMVSKIYLNAIKTEFDEELRNLKERRRTYMGEFIQ